MKRGISGCVIVGLVLGCTCWPGLPARALELTANENAGDGVLGGVVNGTATPESITTNSADATRFRWSDADGNGTADDPVSAGFHLKGWSLTRTSDAVGITLDLFDGTANGVMDGSAGGTNSGAISTVKTSNTGGILITNASSVTIHTLDTRSTSSYVTGGDINLLEVGDVAITNLITGNGLVPHTPGRITVRHAGAFTAGLVSDTVASSSARFTGALVLSGDGSGSCVVGSIKHAAYQIVGAMAIENYQAVTIGTGGIDAHSYANQANNIYIRNIGAGGVHIAGDILSYEAGNDGDYVTSGVFITNIAGSVAVGDIDAHVVDWSATGVHHTKPAGITITAVGNVAVGDLTTYCGSSDSYNDPHPAGDIAIASSSGTVTLGNIDGRSARPVSGSYGADVSLTAFGDITVTGTVVDLTAAYNAAQNGTLMLTSGGRIWMGTTTNATLDCSLLRSAAFNSDAKRTDLAGTLANFDTASTNGDGSVGSPFITTQTKLRAPADQKIYYSYVAGGLNDGLGGLAYRVASLAGTNGTGGLLMVEVMPRGTVFRFR